MWVQERDWSSKDREVSTLCRFDSFDFIFFRLMLFPFLTSFPKIPQRWSFWKCSVVLSILSILFAGVEISVVFGFKVRSDSSQLYKKQLSLSILALSNETLAFVSFHIKALPLICSPRFFRSSRSFDSMARQIQSLQVSWLFLQFSPLWV